MFASPLNRVDSGKFCTFACKKYFRRRQLLHGLFLHGSRPAPRALAKFRPADGQTQRRPEQWRFRHKKRNGGRLLVSIRCFTFVKGRCSRPYVLSQMDPDFRAAEKQNVCKKPSECFRRAGPPQGEKPPHQIKKTPKGVSFIWCGKRDLNPYV